MSDEIITFTNSLGKSIVFNKDGDFILQSLKGVGSPSVISTTQKAPFQDGSTLVSKVFDDRYINISFAIFADDNEDLYSKRRIVMNRLNPKSESGTIRYINVNGIYECESTVDIAPIFSMNTDNYGETYMLCSVSFYCNPFWTYRDFTEIELQGVNAKFEFPTEFVDVEFGTKGSEIDLYNNGDVDIPLTFLISGEIENPIITNEDLGKYLKLEYTVNDGDYVRINTEYGNKEVTLIKPDGTEINIFQYLELGSNFFSLKTGKNKLSYNSTTSGINAEINIKYKERFIGV